MDEVGDRRLPLRAAPLAAGRELLGLLRRWAWLLLLAWVGHRPEAPTRPLLAVSLVLGMIAAARAAWVPLTTRWALGRAALTVQTGWLRVERRVLPLSRIVAVEVAYGPLLAALGLAEVEIRTLGDAEAPLRLRWLERKDAASLQAALRGEGQRAAPSAAWGCPLWLWALWGAMQPRWGAVVLVVGGASQLVGWRPDGVDRPDPVWIDRMLVLGLLLGPAVGAVQAVIQHAGQTLTPTPRGVAVRAGWPVARRWQLERERVASVRWVQGPWLARSGAVRVVIHAVRAADARTGVLTDLTLVVPWLSWSQAEELGAALGVAQQRAFDGGVPLAAVEGHRRRAVALLAGGVGGVALGVVVQPGLGAAWAAAWLAWGIWRGARARATRWGADALGWWRRVEGPWPAWEVAVGARATRAAMLTPPWLAARGVTRLGLGSPGRWFALGLVDAHAAEAAALGWARSAVRRRALGAQLEQHEGAAGGEDGTQHVAVEQREQHAQHGQTDSGVGLASVPADGEAELGGREGEGEAAAGQHPEGHRRTDPIEAPLPAEVER